jgi:hypothetical protein
MDRSNFATPAERTRAFPVDLFGPQDDDEDLSSFIES